MAKYFNSSNFLWKIENFPSIYKEVCPATILIGNLKWQLIFTRYMEDNNKNIRLVLECLSASETLPNWQYRVDINLLHSNGLRYLMKDAVYSLENKEWCVWSKSVTNFYNTYGQMSDITFLIQVTPTGDTESLFRNQESAKEMNSELLCMESFSEDFGKLFNNDMHSDFTLKCGEKSFYVHKNVLSARSDFFAAMFRSNMKEANEGEGKIEDLEPNILELVIRYLYTGKIPELSMETLKKVYTAADRFAVEPLKAKCHLLFIDSFITGCDKDSNKETEKELENVNGQTEFAQTDTKKEKQLLKELFLAREWRTFSEEFPHNAQEMCKHYLLQK